MIHLTNDAVQKKSESYGKYENGNKVSFVDFTKYLDLKFLDQQLNFDHVYNQMKNHATLAIKSIYSNIYQQKINYSFELFGLDFMIDTSGKVFLIEANTNPCLEMNSPLLARLIPTVLDNTFKIAVDPIFPPPEFFLWPTTKKSTICENQFETNKFELIFDEMKDGLPIINQISNAKANQQLTKVFTQIEEEQFLN